MPFLFRSLEYFVFVSGVLKFHGNIRNTVCFHSLNWVLGRPFQSGNLGSSATFHVRRFPQIFGNLSCLLIFKGWVTKS